MATSGPLQTQVVTTKGIFHGLPTYPSSITGLSAVVAGASGISGLHMLRVLSQSPERWSTIYALSRSAPHIPESMAKRVVHVPVDLLKEPEEIAGVLKEAQAKAYVSHLSQAIMRLIASQLGITSSSLPTFNRLPSLARLCGPIVMK